MLRCARSDLNVEDPMFSCERKHHMTSFMTATVTSSSVRNGQYISRGSSLKARDEAAGAVNSHAIGHIAQELSR